MAVGDFMRLDSSRREAHVKHKLQTQIYLGSAFTSPVSADYGATPFIPMNPRQVWVLAVLGAPKCRLGDTGKGTFPH